MLLACQLLGVLLVTLENLEAGLEETLELGVVRRGDKGALQRIIDGLMVRDLVVDIRLVKCRA